MAMLSIFTQYPAEGAIIGRLLAGYSDLEIGMMTCVMTARKDFDAVLKTMYRIGGETQRIDIADALGRSHFHDMRLGARFETMIGSMRHCLQIRNQFAHCAWYVDACGRICFSNLQDVARQHVKFTSLNAMPLRRADLPLLQAQHEYFDYVEASLTWLRWEALRRHDGQDNPHQEPKRLRQPPLYIR